MVKSRWSDGELALEREALVGDPRRRGVGSEGPSSAADERYEPRAKCPTCGVARRRNESAPGDGSRRTCYECGTEFDLLLALEQRSDQVLEAAAGAYRAGQYRVAVARARDAVRLEARPAAYRVLAAASLRCGDFATAVAATRRAVGDV